MVDDSEMWLIAGLGNPGRKYEQNWHNSGFQALDILARRNQLTIDRIRFQGLIGLGKIGETRVMLLKPTTYMNRSGASIREASAFFKIEPSHCLVIYDDIDIPLGQIRIRENGGPGTHNGMRSIVASLGGENFPRIRIGIGPQPEQWDIADFVLSDVPEQARESWMQSATRAAEAVETVCRSGLATTMNQFNRR
jgi:PTH1 family peptidyl-tRNA hydrolase